MRELGIEGVSRRGKNKYRTTTPAKEAPAAPDLVGRRFTAVAPDRLWIADIKYVQTRESYLFLAAVIDVCTRRYVGHSMRDDLKTELVLDALDMAISKRRAAPGLVHHSDRGSQYTSLALGKTLQHAGALPSMGRRGDAYDNALAESFFATLETKLLERHTFHTRAHARIAIFHYLEGFYNTRRHHSALGNLSPRRIEKTMNNNQPRTAIAA